MSAESTATTKTPARIGLTVLGATGTIGVNTLDVVARHPERFKIVALTANSHVERLYEQCVAHEPEFAVMADADAAEKLEQKLRNHGLNTQVLAGTAGLEQVASLPQVLYVMAAIVGAAGLIPTLAAARAGKRILLANKEALVMSGQIFMDEVKSNNAELLPIDSEHNAIFQCMPDTQNKNLHALGVKRILLTASGGPFREAPIETLSRVTPEQACAHPNWVMGRKISVDSATMMNKGLEVIEACWLFNTTPAFIQVVVHPQSIIHSMVQYSDGSVLAQLGNPDMRTPIAHALAWPERIEAGVENLDIFSVAHLDFCKPDYSRFPCLRLAIEAIEQGGTSSAILNAANEVAVQAFLDHKIAFTHIALVIEQTLASVSNSAATSIEAVFEADYAARNHAQQLVAKHSSTFSRQVH
ncbi:MAG: 1-deoxy-D-xylulose 5-phosphate reductoisomerase [Gammaproteobacteria bacterium SG8_11]|nr:MAG: 1-deoxy-D-xylulose 5-phosphate reductoisomerase [Gammaproteobacteria bacterium SG8_11]